MLLERLQTRAAHDARQLISTPPRRRSQFFHCCESLDKLQPTIAIAVLCAATIAVVACVHATRRQCFLTAHRSVCTNKPG